MHRRSGAAQFLVPHLMLWMTSATLTWVLTASTSWACVPQPLLSILPRSSGEPGQAVTLEGLHFSGRVEIRWNTIDGPLLASPIGSPFSVATTVPEAPEGLYALVALERDQAGGIVGVTRSAFEITSMKDDDSTFPVTTPTSITAGRSSTSTPLAAGLGAVGGVVVFLFGSYCGARFTRRR